MQLQTENLGLLRRVADGIAATDIKDTSGAARAVSGSNREFDGGQIVIKET